MVQNRAVDEAVFNVTDPSGDSPSLGKRRAWFLPDDRHTASLVGLRGGWRHARMKFFTRIYGSNAAVPGYRPCITQSQH
ncbi:hypothetical protein TNCV_2863781 [Trichonephila clavipes]|nr:hypothetical protein TNCV_2863781 [Trichonephila clavipes]